MKKVKTCECSNDKKRHRAECDKGSWFSHRSEKCARKKLVFFVFLVSFFSFITWFFSNIYLSIVNILVEANWRNLIGKVLLSREVPFCLL